MQKRKCRDFFWLINALRIRRKIIIEKQKIFCGRVENLQSCIKMFMLYNNYINIIKKINSPD